MNLGLVAFYAADSNKSSNYTDKTAKKKKRERRKQLFRAN